MAIINFSDKLEFQGRGAAHIHGAAWCDIRKISQSINLTVPRSESDEEIDSNSEHEPETIEEIETRILDPDTDLERAFKKLRKSQDLQREDENALIAFADKFTTCTLNPEMAASMIDDKTSVSEGIRIVDIVRKTQTHYHTKTCKKLSPKCRFGMPKFPMWKTMLTKPIKGASSEEMELRRHFNQKVLDDVRNVLKNNDVMNDVWKKYKVKNSESTEEY